MAAGGGVGAGAGVGAGSVGTVPVGPGRRDAVGLAARPLVPAAACCRAVAARRGDRWAADSRGAGEAPPGVSGVC